MRALGIMPHQRPSQCVLPVTLQSLGCQEPCCHLRLRALLFSTPTSVGFSGKVLTLLKLLSVSPSSSCYPICVSQEKIICFLQKTASGYFPFLVLSSLTCLKSHKSCCGVTWAYRCCFTDWHMRKCGRIWV